MISKVAVLCSSRVLPGTELYSLGVQVGNELSRAGCEVVTGGGPGLMAAVSIGAYTNDKSCAVVTRMPNNEKTNLFLNKITVCPTLSERKLTYLIDSDACVFLPGGFGTMDELFEILTLIQVGLVAPKPILLVGLKYWRSLMSYMKNMLKNGYIDSSDLKLIEIVNSPKALIRRLEEHGIGK